MLVLTLTNSLDTNDDPISVDAKLANFFLHNAVGIWRPILGKPPLEDCNFRGKLLKESGTCYPRSKLCNLPRVHLSVPDTMVSKVEDGSDAVLTLAKNCYVANYIPFAVALDVSQWADTSS